MNILFYLASVKLEKLSSTQRPDNKNPHAQQIFLKSISPNVHAYLMSVPIFVLYEVHILTFTCTSRSKKSPNHLNPQHKVHELKVWQTS